MNGILEKSSVKRVLAALSNHKLQGQIRILADTAKSASEAAAGLGIEVGQIASSLIFKLSDNSPLLIITSGRHRVDIKLVSTTLGVDKLERVDADYVREKSGFSIGGVSPIGWLNPPALTLLDEALGDYPIIWAAAGHPHAVFPTSFNELQAVLNPKVLRVGV